VSQESVISPVPIIYWQNVSFVDTGGLNRFSDAGQTTYRIVTSSAYSGNILPMRSSHTGANYTYTLTFPGPRLRCSDVKDYSKFNHAKLNGILGRDNVAYNATDLSLVAGFPDSPIPAEDQFDLYFLTPTRNFTCETWNVTYTAKFSFFNGEQSIEVTNVQYDHRFLPLSQTGVQNTADYCPFSYCGYRGWFKAVAAILTGSASWAGVSNTFRAKSPILQTTLIGCPEMAAAAEKSRIIGISCPAPSLELGIEAFSQNATLSFFGAIPSV
jgi:hypothetical protein